MPVLKTKIPWHALSADEIAGILKVNPEKGLNPAEVAERSEEKNVLPSPKKISSFNIFLRQLASPLIYILLAAGCFSLIFQEIANAIVIFGAVFINTIVGYLQETKASNTLRQLKKITRNKAIVLRDNKEKEILQSELVRGDIVILKSGNKVPADARIIKSWNLKIQEASLTGEWLSAEKHTKLLPEKTPLADRDNMAFMGTIIEDGTGRAIVVNIGKHTEIGKVAKLIVETKEQKTPYQKKLARFSKLIGIIITIVSVLIFIDGILTHRPFVEMLITAVAVAVAAIPEGMPVAITVILALSMRRILEKKGLVRKLASAETLGSTSVIATDKTLTLTQGKMRVNAVVAEDKRLALEIACLANEAFVENPQEPPRNWRINGRPTDTALVEAAGEKGIYKTELEKIYDKTNEIPFNSENKYIAAFYKKQNSLFLYISGAPEKILALSVKVKGKTRQSKLTKASSEHFEKQLRKLTRDGLRVIAVAYKKFRKGQFKNPKNLSEKDIFALTFVGFIGLKDPLRQDAKKAFQICKKAGMKPIIVTGDHLLTAMAIGRELDLSLKKENVMVGSELDDLSDRELRKKLNHINLFARVEPRHKLRIIKAWQEKNNVVAMVGDGVNDAAALKKADIGVSLGSGTDVAKEVSDIILLNDNFSILVSAVEEGRVILDNIRKVTTYLLSGSFTEMILIGFAILFKLPLPVLAAQILWVNLIEDSLPNVALAFEKKEDDLMEQKPSPHNAPLLTKEMKIIIFAIGVITDFILLGLFLLLYNRFGISHMQYIRTMIFAGLSIDSLFYMFSCRSLRKNIWHMNIFSNRLLILAWGIGWLFLLAGIYLPICQKLLSTIAIGKFDWLILFSLGLIKLALIEITKHYFISSRKIKAKN